MEQLKPKFKINWDNIAAVFLILFVISLFFPVRFVFPDQNAFVTGAYSDFTSISLYLSDIFLILTTILTILPRGEIPPRGRTLLSRDILPLVSFATWLVLLLLINTHQISGLNIWFFVKFMELIVAYGTFSVLVKRQNYSKHLAAVFLALSSFESALALHQFTFQRPLGIYKLGELALSPNIKGIAKIVVNGSTYIRGYGTFPHPNLLSAFLVVAVLLAFWLFSRETNKKNKYLLSFVMLLNVFGLITTFSRASFLALAISVAVLSLTSLAHKAFTKQFAVALAILIVCLLSAFAAFKPYLLTRATVTDQASLERVFYAKTGIKIIKDHPIFGIGIGESVIHMQQYALFKLWPWQIQPIHNYFLLASAELGIPGALILLGIMLWLECQALKIFWQYPQQERGGASLLLFTILIAFLVLMQFDHYFYTLEQTQMLLWIVLGFIAAQTQNPSPRVEKGGGEIAANLKS